MFELLYKYYDKSSIITISISIILFIYTVTLFWIFIYRYLLINRVISIESYSLKKLYLGRISTVDENSLLFPYVNRVLIPNRAIFSVAKGRAIKVASRGLTTLSIVSSTAPFIGLFGTVVSILEALSNLSIESGSGLSIIAPMISHSLVTTAGGIAVATFAYTFHLILKRRVYELGVLLDNQADLILAQKE
ncbi:MAG: MotA/TolQ/ExbB proton channel family protein [Epsilonproteobacteria bacterium]|nr:MotA/TolQ/ExbB proton channel family protein [Campylobacterota bacterium]